MKKNFIFCLLATFCSISLFTACSDDDDNNVDTTINDIVGTYDGTLQVLGQPIDEKITLEKISDSKVKVILEDFEFMGMPIGDISAECMAVKDDDGHLDLTGTSTVFVAMFEAELPVAINGDADGKNLELEITIQEIPNIGVLSVEFNGNK